MNAARLSSAIADARQTEDLVLELEAVAGHEVRTDDG
jgi:hypothetical protein